MRRRILAVGGGLILVVAACESFGSDAPPMGSSSGSDGAAPDASVTPDGHADAGCPSGGVFCDDFEEGSLSRWARSELAKHGVVALAQVAGESNHALQAHSPANDAGGTSAVEIATFAASLPGTVAMRARVRFAQPPGANLHVLTLQGFLAEDTSRKNPSINHAIVAYPDRWRVETFSTTARYKERDTSTAPPLDAWTCVELDTTLSADKGHLRFFVNDTLLLDQDATTLEPSSMPVGALELRAGFVTDAPIAAAQEVFVDDVVVKATPDTEVGGPARIGCAL